MARFRHHKYTYSRPFGSPRHMWELLGPLGGIQFTASFYDNTSEPSCGLEFHHTRASKYRCDAAPDHIKCFLTGEPCWHDGTSLYASETVWPQIASQLHSGDHDAIFRNLEWEYDRHFNRLSEDAEDPRESLSDRQHQAAMEGAA